MTRLEKQARELTDLLSQVGVSAEVFAARCAIKPDTLRKFQRGYMPASEPMMQSMRNAALLILLERAQKPAGQTEADLVQALRSTVDKITQLLDAKTNPPKVKPPHSMKDLALEILDDTAAGIARAPATAKPAKKALLPVPRTDQRKVQTPSRPQPDRDHPDKFSTGKSCVDCSKS